MSSATTAGTNAGRMGRGLILPAASVPKLLVFPVIAFIWWRLADHALWQDEAQAWNLAIASRTPFALFHALGYEGHPGAWYLLLWLTSFISIDPAAMQILHGAIAAAICLVITYWSPFDAIERVLLILSYYVSFEYAVISRNYSLAVLAVFLYLHLRAPGNRRPVWQFALLGFAANVNLFAFILSGSIVLVRLPQDFRDWRAGDNRTAAGLMLFAALAALAVLTMWPAPDHLDQRVSAFNQSGKHLPIVSFISTAALYGGHGFLPLNWLRRPFGDTGAYLLRFLLPIAYLPLRLFRNERDLLSVYLLTLVTSILFGIVFLPGEARHHGIMFVAFVFGYWTMRAHGPGRDAGRHTGRSRIALFLLAVNAACGIAVNAATFFYPYSASAASARWIAAHHLEGAYWIASPDHAAAVSAYLGQWPIRDTSCEIPETYTHWRKGCTVPSEMEATARIQQMLRRDHPETAYILRGAGAPVDLLAIYRDDHYTSRRLADFENNMVPDEDFDIYRLDREPPATPRR